MKEIQTLVRLRQAGRLISTVMIKFRKPGGIVLLTAGIFAVMLVRTTSLPQHGQASTTSSTQRGQENRRNPRTVPSLGVYMLAYEAASTNKKGVDAEMVKALNKAFAENPDARRTFARLHQAYQALPVERRKALIGQELAMANAEARLSQDVIKRSLFARMSVARSPVEFTKIPSSEKAPKRTQIARSKPESLEAKDAQGLAPGLRLKRQDAWQIGKEVTLIKPLKSTQPPPPPPQKKYRIAYRGIYLTDEDDDWGASCEPYVIFVMHQGGATWTRRAGPYSMDDGDKKYKDWDLLSQTSFNTPLQVTAFGWENDSWDPNDVQNAVSAAVSAGCALASSQGVDCSSQIEDIAKDILNWFIGLFGNDDDEVGPPKTFTLDKAYAQTHTGSTVDPDSGHVKDFWLLFDGDGDTEWGDEYRYWVAIDVIPIN